MNQLNISRIHEIADDFVKDPINIVTSNAYHMTDFCNLVINQKVLDTTDHIFSNSCTDSISPMDQNSAGVCWICGGLSVCRRSIIKNLNLDNKFNMSINYLLFWDKLEKCNYYINYIIENRKLKPTKDKIHDLISSPCCDGGSWHNFVDLVNKYGMVPDTVYKRKYSSKNTKNMNKLINHKLREFTSIIMSRNVLTKIIMRMIGVPIFPDTIFVWVYLNKTNEKKIINTLNPLSFFNNFCDLKLDQFLQIINDPRKRHPYNKLYIKKDIHDIINPTLNVQSLVMLNLPNDEIIELIVKQIDAKIPVWFSCDVDKYVNHQHNIMDIDIYNYGLPFNTSFTRMSKSDRLDFYDSYPNHVMTIIGYDFDTQVSDNSKKRKLSDGVLKFKVENSWGETGKNEGHYTMTIEWFKMFGYNLSIDRRFLNQSHIECLGNKPYVLHKNDLFLSKLILVFEI